jgi:transketolase
MRKTFTQTLIELADRDPRVLLLTGDLGFMVLEPFIERHPDRFFNAGVAEQNMLGMATGLAQAGFIPFCYSIVTFAALRPYEFIRNGAILQHLPVRVVSVGGGFEYGDAGPTHHGVEDMAIMRVQPGMMTVAPADAAQARTAIQSTWDMPTPIYYRLGKDDAYSLPGLDGAFAVGRATLLREGRDLLFVTAGAIARETVSAADALAARGIQAGVLIVPTFNPDPADDLAAALAGVPLAISVEAHYVNGGVGSLVAEIIAERAIPTRLIRCGVRENHDGLSGSQAYYQRKHGIAAESLVETAVSALQAAS